MIPPPLRSTHTDTLFPYTTRFRSQLYTGWGSLEKFQRTRGVLRLMAQAIHELWMNGDPSVMIMPGSVAVSSPRVEPELLHYLDVTWQSIIAGDVDGTRSDEPRVGKACGSPFRSRRSPYH